MHHARKCRLVNSGPLSQRSALLARGPVHICFYRGEWCPFCNIELRTPQQALPTIQQLGATLLAISPEEPDHGIVAAEKNKLTFPVLSDFGNRVARQFGIVFQVGQELKEFSKNVFKNDIALRNGEDSYELPVPATYLIDTSGVIRFAHVDVDYMTGRAEPPEIISALKAIAHPVGRSFSTSSFFPEVYKKSDLAWSREVGF